MLGLFGGKRQCGRRNRGQTPSAVGISRLNLYDPGMSKSFSKNLISSVLSRRSEIVKGKNIDDWRFPNREPKRYDPEALLNQISFLHENRGALDNAAALLKDDASRALLAEVMAYRALGPMHVKLPTNTPAYWDGYTRAAEWECESFHEPRAPQWEFGKYRFNVDETPLDINCWVADIVFTFIYRQYYFERQGVRIQPEIGDYVIDAGACFGDTGLCFALSVGPTGRIFSFEPMSQRGIAQENLDRNRPLSDRVEILPYALSEESDQTLMFTDGGVGAKAHAKGTIEVQSLSVDDFVTRNEVKKIDLIKMDIEGSERSALAGAERTIRDFRPKLAISLYHRPDDVFFLPAQVKAMLPDYDLYIDHYTVHNEEMVLYAIPG